MITVDSGIRVGSRRLATAASMPRWSRNRALRATTALVCVSLAGLVALPGAVVLSAMSATEAAADEGGNGGDGNGSGAAPGGDGGQPLAPGGEGANGNTDTTATGGGGGGGGMWGSGGDGGDGGIVNGDGGLGGAGGSRALLVGMDGEDGQDAPAGDVMVSAGGGGGGGAPGRYITGGSSVIVMPYNGGDGGDGGAGSFYSVPGSVGRGGGGGGGAGGAGMVSLANVGFTINGNLNGGFGGDGGAGARGGDGGNGGSGFRSLVGGNVTNNAWIVGGNGGLGGMGLGDTFTPATSGMTGSGGVGVLGANLRILNNGLIAGGFAGGHGGDEEFRANAITFTDGMNQLTFGDATSGLLGDVSVTGSLTLVQDNGVDVTVANVIKGTGSVIKAGSASVTLTATNTFTGGTTVAEGLLVLGNAGGNALHDMGFVDVGIAGNLTLETDETIGSLSGSGVVSLGNNTLTTGGDGTNTTFSGTIGGSGGGLTKVGAGTMTLTGTNTYTGRTTFSEGAIRIENSAALGASSLQMNGGTLLSSFTGALANEVRFEAGTSSTIAATAGTTLTLSGPMSLLSNADAHFGQAGVDGTVVLSIGNPGAVANTDIFIDGGTVRLDNYGAQILFNSGGSATVAAGAVLEFDEANISALPVNALFGSGTVRTGTNPTSIVRVESGDFSGGLVGAGGLSVICVASCTGGTLILSGTGLNTYSGPTTIGYLSAFPAYTLRGGAPNAFSAQSPVTVSTFSTLDLGGFDQEIGSLAGAGTVSNSGADDAVLTTGGNDNSTTFSGLIEDGAGGGTFGLTKTGSGEMELTGVNSYTGLTTVTDGILGIAAGSSITGDTTVNGGLFRVNGEAGNVLVGAGGALGGTGRVGTTTIGSGGTLAPGNSIDTITVVGDLMFAGGSTYAVEVDPNSADRTDVVAGLGGTGTATLTGGTVVADYAAATYIAKTYTILSAEGGLGGTSFAGLTGTLPAGTEVKLAYDANNAYLVLDLVMRPEEPGEPEVPEPPTDPEAPDYGDLNLNQLSVADVIVGYFDANGGIAADFAALDPQGLSQVSGEVRAGAVTAGIESADRFLDLIAGEANRDGGPGGSIPGAVDARTSAYAETNAYAGEGAGDGRAAPGTFAALDKQSAHAAEPLAKTFAGRWTGWGAAYGGSMTVDGDAVLGSHQVGTDAFGLASGFSARFDDTAIGVALGGGWSNYDLADDMGSGKAGVFNAGLYGRQGFGDAYVSGALAYGFYDFDTSRPVPGDTLDGSFNAHSWSGRIEGGYRFDMPIAALTPYAAFQAIALHMPGYSERSVAGGLFGLNYGGDTIAAMRTELGLRLDHTLALDNGASLTLSGRAAWAINAGDDNVFTAGFQELPGASFVIEGAEPDDNAALIDAGAEYHDPSGFFASVAFQGEFSQNVESYTGKARIGIRW